MCANHRDVAGCCDDTQGAYLLEDTVYSKDGVFMSNDTWEYKPPLALNVPIDFRVELLKDSAFEKGVFRAKASGGAAVV